MDDHPKINLTIGSCNSRYDDARTITFNSLYAALTQARQELEGELCSVDWSYMPDEKEAREQAIEGIDALLAEATDTWSGPLEFFVTAGAFEFQVGDPTYEPVRYRIEVAQ